MANMLEARLTEEFLRPAELPGIIHSKFHSVMNVQFKMPFGEKRLVTVVTAGTAGIPDSITVDREYFSQLLPLPVGSELWCKNMTIRFEGVADPLVGDEQCLRGSNLLIRSPSGIGRRAPGDIDIYGMAFVKGFAHFKEELDRLAVDGCRNDGLSALGLRRKREIVSGLQAFAWSWLEHDTAKMEIGLLKYVGLGIGLTPSCDDAFLGIIAMYSGARLYAQTAFERMGETFLKWRSLPDIGSLSHFKERLFNRTTDVSLKYLCCAQEKRFSDPVIDLVDAIFFDTNVPMGACVKQASMVGESSGMDMLLGAEIACQVLWESVRPDSENQAKQGGK